MSPRRETCRVMVAMPDSRRAEIVERVRAACESGQQAYWVCPLIDESEQLDYQAAEASFEALQKALPSLTVGLVHGRMKASQKDRVMRAFKDGQIQVLVATTVIEVGVDVPNASVILIEDAERFGLAQLHQLRGRVGRGAEESYCILLADGPEPDRLHGFAASQDGFEIAELDLQERGMGDLIGARQSGAIEVHDYTSDSTCPGI
mgnify:CR=1 FL=1